MRNLFRTRVPIAFAVLTALLGVPAAPADATVVFAGACPTTARIDGTRLILDAGCILVPHVTASLHAEGALTPVLPLGPCMTGVYRSDGYMVWTAANESGTLHAINTGTLELFFVSTNMRMTFLGELVPTAMNGTCPSGWTGVLVIEDPAL